MDHFVTLERLPDGLEFPPEMGGRIGYDPERRRLGFRGFMSKAEYDRLFALSDDWTYRRQLEELFRLSVPEPAGSGTRLGLVAAAVASVGLALGAGALWAWQHRAGHAGPRVAGGTDGSAREPAPPEIRLPGE